jgi:hypothetical protein
LIPNRVSREAEQKSSSDIVHDENNPDVAKHRQKPQNKRDDQNRLHDAEMLQETLNQIYDVDEEHTG